MNLGDLATMGRLSQEVENQRTVSVYRAQAKLKEASKYGMSELGREFGRQIGKEISSSVTSDLPYSQLQLEAEYKRIVENPNSPLGVTRTSSGKVSKTKWYKRMTLQEWALWSKMKAM